MSRQPRLGAADGGIGEPDGGRGADAWCTGHIDGPAPEALLLSLLGGVGGTVVGTGITAGYALSRDWPVVVPVWATAAGLGVTALIGMIAGLWPAVRASRMSPTEALTVL